MAYRVAAGDSFKWLYDCDYKGSDLVTINNGTKSLMRCAEACLNNTNCNLFTFNAKSSICTLKKVTDTGKRVTSQGSICGLIEKRIPQFKQLAVGTLAEEHRKWTVAQNGSYWWSQGCTIFGYDTQRIDRVNTIDDCAQPCRARKEQCTHFVFDSNDGSCVLKMVNNYPYVTAQDDQPSNIFCGFTFVDNDNVDFNNVELFNNIILPPKCACDATGNQELTPTAAGVDDFSFFVLE